MESQYLLLNVPSELTTDRLHLRNPRLGDGVTIVGAALASLPELQRWMPWATDNYGVDDAEMWCRRVVSKLLMRTEFPFLMFTRAGEHIGNIGLFAIEWEVPKVEIGYWLATSHCGHGYMTEAVAAIGQFAREQLKVERVEIRTDAENVPSRRVAERSGYRLEATMRKYERNPRGELRDECIFAKTDW